MYHLFNIINKLHNNPKKQSGAALMVMLVILVVGASAILISSLNTSALKVERDTITAQALAQAKAALIGRAVADTSSPGSLPCPDTHTVGTTNEGVADSGSSCPNYIGRLPWKSLGLPDLRDSSGERLWYALSPNFRDNVTSNPINSNSKGTLLVNDNSGTNLLTPPGSEAIAIIFAPGNIVGNQQRDISNQNIASNYLDIGPGNINNANVNGPFIQANLTVSFNDQLMIMTAQDVINLIEVRVANELAKALISYASSHGNSYPNPGNISTCTSVSCSSDSTQCIGKVPFSSMTSELVSLPWFVNNNWSDVIYYSAGTNSLSGMAGGGWIGSTRYHGKTGSSSWGGAGGIGNTACSSAFLTILDTNGGTLSNAANGILIMPGSPLGGITRSPITLSPAPNGNLPGYFEDPENQNLDNIYVIPGGTSNDLLYILQ